MVSEASTGVGDLLALVPVSAEWKRKLCSLMSGRDRAYHDTHHIALLFDRHRRFAPEAGFDGTADTRLVSSAIAFHDCIYEASRGDNETRSAEVWLEASESCGLDTHERTWVADTIRATADHLGCGGRESAHADRGEALRLWMLDLDLTPLGEAPDVFDRNARLLRAEAPHLDDAAFEAARLRFLRRFAEAPIIYRTPTIFARFEAPARRNLARHLTASASL